MSVMNGLNARLEGLALQQLSKGHGTWSVIHDLVRLGRIDTTTAQAIVERVRPRLQIQARTQGRGTFFFGLLVLAIPASIFAAIAYGRIFYPFGMIGGPTFSEALGWMLYPPMFLVEIVGIALTLTGWSTMRRARKSVATDLPGAPLQTGLWWRADPFEWK